MDTSISPYFKTQDLKRFQRVTGGHAWASLRTVNPIKNNVIHRIIIKIKQTVHGNIMFGLLSKP